MSRITGTDAFNMMEAYNAVYAPQELTEEQVWEEIEAWVNSLVEEGYDLSEYTWEDMYEEYLNEMGQTRTTGQATAPVSNAPYRSRFARPMNAGTPQQTGRGTSVSRPQIGSLPSNYRGAELQQTARARASQVGTTRQGTAGGPTTGGNTPIGTSPARPAVRPAPASARPTAQVPTRPAAAPGQAKPTTTATPPAAPATAPAAPRQRDTSITDMIGRSQIRQGAPINTGNASSDIRSRALRGTDVGGAGGSVAAPVVTARPSVQQQIRQRRLNMDLDLFDIVKGYLIDEGYAETEEAASVIMANMSEEWRQSIIEQQVVSDPGGKGGKVTVGTEYPAVYRGQKGMKFTSVTGQRYFTPDSKGFAKTTPSK